jgi:hypothetical protein
MNDEEHALADQITELLMTLAPHRRVTVLKLLWERFSMGDWPDAA